MPFGLQHLPLRLETCQQLLTAHLSQPRFLFGPRNHVRWQPELVGNGKRLATSRQAIDKLVTRLQGVEIKIDRGARHLRRRHGIRLDGAVVGGGQRHGAAVVKVLQNRYPQRPPLHGISPRSQFVQQYQRVRGHLLHHGANVGQMR